MRISDWSSDVCSSDLRVEFLRGGYLVHGGQVITDSWHIAQHIEGSYPDRPALFGDRCPVALAKFINSWADADLVSALVPIILLDIYTLLGGDDEDYFRLSREQHFGMTLEHVVAERPGHFDRKRTSLNYSH